MADLTPAEVQAKIDGFQTFIDNTEAFIDDTEKRLAELEGAKTEPSGTVADHENVAGILRLMARHGIKPNPELDELEAQAEAKEENADDTALNSGTN